MRKRRIGHGLKPVKSVTPDLPAKDENGNVIPNPQTLDIGWARNQFVAAGDTSMTEDDVEVNPTVWRRVVETVPYRSVRVTECGLLVKTDYCDYENDLIGYTIRQGGGRPTHFVTPWAWSFYNTHRYGGRNVTDRTVNGDPADGLSDHQRDAIALVEDWTRPAPRRYRNVTITEVNEDPLCTTCNDAGITVTRPGVVDYCPAVGCEARNHVRVTDGGRSIIRQHNISADINRPDIPAAGSSPMRICDTTGFRCLEARCLLQNECQDFDAPRQIDAQGVEIDFD